MNFLRDILEDLKNRFENKCTTNDFQLKRQLNVLNQFEKQLIRKKILELEYSIGSLKVFKMLKDCEILTITDYLLAQTTEEDLQGIIGDVIDLDTSQQLLKEVIISSKNSVVINTHFQQCFIQYTYDVMNRQELIKNEFVASVEPLLKAEDFWELIAARFLNEILAQDEPQYSELTQVLSDQKAWNLLYEDKKLKATCNILQNISKNHSEDIVKFVLKHLQSDEKIKWFHLLLICRHADHKSTATTDVKYFLKKLLNKFHETSNVDHLLMTFIIARQFFHYSETSPLLYQSWLKTSVGEMNYNLKDSQKFTMAIETLQLIISYENDIDIVNIHAETAISSPRGTHHLVLEYKQMLRTKSAVWTTPEAVIDLV